MTKNSAEVQAATLAIQMAAKEGIKKLLINSQNQQLVNSAGWIPGWKVGQFAHLCFYCPFSQKKGWVTAKGDPVKNKEELILLDEELTAHKELEVK